MYVPNFMSESVTASSSKTREELLPYIAKCSKKKSTGFDNFPGFLLKFVFEYIVNPLVYIINMVLEHGVFPERLKTSKIIPIHKKGPKQDLNNYRPIALQSVFSKLIELVIYTRLVNFIDKHDILSTSQHGFRKGKSTTTAIFNFLNKIYESVDNKQYTIGIFYDLSKAFDTINHELLLNKLSMIGINGVANNLLRSYLSNRLQFVSLRHETDSSVDSVSSDLIKNNCGVPQGSILGPLLFILFINDLPSNLLSSYPTIYADDTSQVITNNSFEDVLSNILSSVTEMNHWCEQNGLVLNLNKTALLNFHSRGKDPDYSLYVKVNATSIKTTNQIKFLGVTLSDILSWEQHIKTLSSKLTKICYQLLQCRMIVDSQHVLRTIYFSNFQSISEYGIIFWGKTSALNRIFIIQKRAIRIMTKSKSRASCRELFKSLNILTMPCLHIYKCICFVRDNIHLFSNNDIHYHNTRNKSQLRIPQHRLTVFQQGAYYTCVSFYNKLPPAIKNLSSTNSFKHSLKSFLIENSFYSCNEYLSQ